VEVDQLSGIDESHHFGYLVVGIVAVAYSFRYQSVHTDGQTNGYANMACSTRLGIMI